MELDHQQMAGASFGKPITAAVPGIRGDSSEVGWLGISPVRKLFILFGSFIWFSLFISASLLTLEAAPQSSICRRSRQAGKSERGTGAASHGSMGIGNTWHSSARELPPDTATLAKKHQKQVQVPCRNAGIPSEVSFEQGEGIYCRAWGSCSRIKFLWVPAEIIEFGPHVTSPSVHSFYSHLPCWVLVAKLTGWGLSLLQHHNW